MIDMDFSFEENPWEVYARGLQEDEVIDGEYILALMEGETEEAFEEALQWIEDSDHWLDISNLPQVSYSGENGLRLRAELEFAQKGMKLETLEETDPLRLYLEELASIPVCGDVTVLAEELAKANRAETDAEGIRVKLVNLLLSRVVELSAEFVGQGVLLLDLIQEGSIGLWKATQVFVGHSKDFEKVCDWWIRFYMSKAVLLQARAGGVGQKLRTAMEDYRTVDEKLLGDLGRNPTLEEIAEEMHMKPEEAAVVKGMVDNARMLSMAKKPEDDEEEAEAEEQAVEDTAYFQMRQRISELLSGLSEADAKLLTLRFGLEGGKPLAPEDAGRRLGLTPDEVVAREGAALAKLRKN